MKQIAIYTDCLGNKNWSTPENVIDKKTAKQILSIAKILANTSTPGSVRAIELYAKIMKPVYGTPQMALALLDYHAALKAEGLAYDTDEGVNEYALSVLTHPKELSSRDEDIH